MKTKNKIMLIVLFILIILGFVFYFMIKTPPFVTVVVVRLDNIILLQV